MLQSLRRTGHRSALSNFLTVAALLAGTVRGVSAQAAPPPDFKNPFPAMPEGVVPRFELRDLRALEMLQYINCMNNTVAAAKQGVLGVVPNDALIVCVREKNEWRGVAGVLSTDRSQFRVLSQLALRSTAVRTADRVDTSLAASIARAMVRGSSTPPRGGSRYTFTAVPLKLETFVEVWFMPVQSSATKLFVGGDSLIQMTPDGRREQGHFATSPPVRELPMPSGRTFVIESSEDELPLVSELLAARVALLRVNEVKIRTRRFESTISNSTRKWTHAPRRP